MTPQNPRDDLDAEDELVSPLVSLAMTGCAIVIGVAMWALVILVGVAVWRWLQ